MKYDSVAVSTQPFAKVALISQKINTSVTQNYSLLGAYGMGGGGGGQ
jgi:hypothetical protein